MIEVLVVTGNMNVGGVRQVVTNIVTGINRDKFLVYLYVLCKMDKQTIASLHQENIVLIDDFETIRESSKTNKRLLLYRQLSSFLDKHPNIQALHNHCNNEAPEVLLAAKRHKIPVICTHSHAAYSKYWNPSMFPLKSRLAGPFFRIISNRIPTHRIGCSQAACRTAYGTTEGTYYIPNGVDLKKFSPNNLPEKKMLREKYGLQKNKKILIFVGRFSPQKNMIFMLRAFSHLVKMNSEYFLVIVGYGGLESEAHREVEKNAIADSVRFFPSDSNVPELLKASDYFITPSLYEGLGIVFIEAQLMGLPCFASDQVPDEADLGLCEFIPLSLGVEGYSEYIHDYVSQNKQESRSIDPERKELFDLGNVIATYEKIYSGDF